MKATDRELKVWDWQLRLFHWLLVVTIAIAFLSAEEDSPLNQWHVLSGWLAGILIVFRLIWGFAGGEHSRFADFVRPSRIGDHVSGLLHGRFDATLGHNPLGAVSVVALLALVAATVSTGALGVGEDLHELVGWTLLAMVGLHIAAVIAMSLLQRENLVRAMVTGNKPAARHPGAASARPPSFLGIFVAALVLVATVYAILQYDPQAFTLRSADSFEHRAADVSDHSRGSEGAEQDD
jgi:cytochrome b